MDGSRSMEVNTFTDFVLCQLVQHFNCGLLDISVMHKL